MLLYRLEGKNGLIQLFSKGGSYLITSSARYSTDGGIVMPSCLAVFMLTTSLNFVGLSTVEGLSIFDSFRSWFDRLTTNGE